jgi:hypothetical protein
MSTNDKSKDSKEIADFLGVRVLTPLEELSVAGGEEQHDHDVGNDHDHVYHKSNGNNTL